MAPCMPCQPATPRPAVPAARPRGQRACPAPDAGGLQGQRARRAEGARQRAHDAARQLAGRHRTGGVALTATGARITSALRHSTERPDAAGPASQSAGHTRPAQLPPRLPTHAGGVRQRSAAHSRAARRPVAGTLSDTRQHRGAVQCTDGPAVHASRGQLRQASAGHVPQPSWPPVPSSAGRVLRATSTGGERRRDSCARWRAQATRRSLFAPLVRGGTHGAFRALLWHPVWHPCPVPTAATTAPQPPLSRQLTPGPALISTGLTAASAERRSRQLPAARPQRSRRGLQACRLHRHA